VIGVVVNGIDLGSPDYYYYYGAKAGGSYYDTEADAAPEEIDA
jgi:hypothetical protein